MVNYPPSNAGDKGSIPGLGTKIPQAVGQLRPCTTTTGLTCSRTLALNKRSPQMATETQHSKKKKKYIYIYIIRAVLISEDSNSSNK